MADFHASAMAAWRKAFSKSAFAIALKTSWVHTKIKGVRGGRVIVCKDCGKTRPYNDIHIDHLDPVIPVDVAAKDMSWDTIYQRLFCEASNLQPLCKACHKVKSAGEMSERAKHRRLRKLQELPTNKQEEQFSLEEAFKGTF